MSKELTVPNEVEMVTLDEDESGSSGLQNVTESDQVVPRLQIAAGTSKQIMKGDEQYIPGLQVGDIFNTVTKEVYGDSVRVIPVWFSKNRILFDQDWKMECSSPDGEKGGKLSPKCADCEYSQWGSGQNDVGFACTEFRNFAVLVIDQETSSPTLASVSFKGTSSGAAKTWISMIEARRAKDPDGRLVPMPMYRGLYTLKPSAKENPKKKAVFYIWGVNNAGVVSAKTKEGTYMLAAAKEAHARFMKAELRMTGENDNG